MSLIGLVPKILVEVCISNLLDGLNIVHRIYTAVVIVHVDADFLESTLGQQEALDSGQRGPR